MLDLLILLICTGILASGVLAVCLKDLMAAMISAGLTSLFAAVSYVLLAAPDVAMAEAAIGSGLATFIFLYAIRRTSGGVSTMETGEE
ncbi:Na(+)/H(+) antiporter subunit B [Beijerinckia mobilis]|uniref:Na(+)/H(+) antiporter subunit B n=1 Tax=Beijerinckia mobilis TaxID=231434 RepID=UPI00054FDB65|nr:hydrogenase subunit MbhD domain-containing protein [Beijerinckia mobilis]